MPKPSSQAEIINVLKSNQEKEDDDGKEDVLADVSEQELGGVQLVHVQEEEKEEEEDLADVS